MSTVSWEITKIILISHKISNAFKKKKKRITNIFLTNKQLCNIGEFISNAFKKKKKRMTNIFLTNKQLCNIGEFISVRSPTHYSFSNYILKHDTLKYTVYIYIYKYII